MNQKYEELVKYVQSMETDVQKFYEKGQAAAGTRLRKSLSDLKKMAQEFRNEIQEIKTKKKEEKKSDQPSA